MNLQKVHIYTDGAALGNPGPGGYGVVMQLISSKKIDYQKEFSQGYKYTTNNRMELLAVIEALRRLKTKALDVTVYTDSKYVSDAINKGWVFQWKAKGFKDKKNVDLWLEFLGIYAKFKVIRLEWVRGHNGNVFNERCDLLAVLAAKGEDLLVDVGYDK